MIDRDAIIRRSEATVRPMVDEFDAIKGELKEIAKHVYPLGKRGLDAEVEDLAHRAEEVKQDEIVDTVPLSALRKGAAGFLVNLMNPAQKWVHLEPSSLRGSDDDGDGEVSGGAGSRSAMIEKLERIVKDSMAKSGSYRDFKRMFEHLLAFGFACVIVREDKRFIARAECLRVGTYSFGCGADGKVNRVERRFAMTAEEIVREFGGGRDGRAHIPDDVMRAWRSGATGGPQANFVVENLIEPNETTYACGTDDVLDYGLPRSAKYRSVYWLRGRKGIGACGSALLAVRGFKFNPVVAPRLDAERGDVYGRGQGHAALNSCRGLQAAMMDACEIVSNRAEPPVIASNELRDEGLNLGRGGVTYANVGEQRSQLVYPVLPNPPTSNDVTELIAKFEQQVKDIFFNGEFTTIDSLKTVAPGDKRTAAEVNALKSENLMLLGGIVLTMDDEAIDPIVNAFTEYALASRKWREQSAGYEVRASDLEPRYVSSLHLAQRTQEINSTENSLQFALGLAQTNDPRALAVLDLFDFDRIVRRRHKLVGGSELDLKNEEAVEASREEQRKAAEEAAEIQREAAAAENDLTRAKSVAQAGRAAESAVDAHILGGDMAEQLGGW